MSSYVTDSDPSDLAFMPNATTGSNTVIMSCMKLMSPGDSIVTLNTAYGVIYSYVLFHISLIYPYCFVGTVKTLLEYVAKQFEVHLYTIDIKFPPKSKEEVCTYKYQFVPLIDSITM